MPPEYLLQPGKIGQPQETVNGAIITIEETSASGLLISKERKIRDSNGHLYGTETNIFLNPSSSALVEPAFNDNNNQGLILEQINPSKIIETTEVKQVLEKTMINLKIAKATSAALALAALFFYELGGIFDLAPFIEEIDEAMVGGVLFSVLAIGALVATGHLIDNKNDHNSLLEKANRLNTKTLAYYQNISPNARILIQE